jgi:serine/threonine protein kinase
MIGSLIQDRYHIEAELGRGGMGAVYRAEDTILERPVAIKFVTAAGLGAEGQARLLQEAQAAARLNHPNIIAVHDVGQAELAGQEGTSSFIVMELAEGHTLREHQPQELDETIDIVKAICDALAAAHSQGIIHRDLKPENVIVTPSGKVKLMDFGLARITDKTRLTQQGAFVGTLSYLAPEIMQGQEASPRSDLYALGVMLYEMSAARPPFEAGTVAAVMSQHLHAPVVPPSTYNENIPTTLDRLIVQLLSKNPADRPESAEAVRIRLQKVAEASASPQPLSPNSTAWSAAGWWAAKRSSPRPLPCGRSRRPGKASCSWSAASRVSARPAWSRS